MSESLNQTIEKRARQLLQLAAPLCATHRVRVPDPVICFDLRGQAAGQAVWHRARRPLLRFNLDIARLHREDFLKGTVTHEVAHLVTAACHGRVRPHGPEWRAVMAYLGIPRPSRCHSYKLDESAIRRQRRWAYECACTRHELSTTRHNRIQAAATVYHCRCCGSALRPVTCGAD